MELFLIYQKESEQLESLYNMFKKYCEVKPVKLEDYQKKRLNSYDKVVVFVEYLNKALLRFMEEEYPILILPRKVGLDFSLCSSKLLYYAYGWSALKSDAFFKQGEYCTLSLIKLLINKAKGAILENAWKKVNNLWCINASKVKFVESLESEEIINLIEEIYKKDFFLSAIKILASFAKSEDQIKDFSKLISRNYFPNIYERKIFFDISLLNSRDSGTGIHRVVKAQINCLISSLIPKFRVEPSYIAFESGILKVNYAREWVKKLINLKERALKDTPIVPRKGDIYYIPDFYPIRTLEAYKSGFLDYLREKGVDTVFLVYDMIPIKFPHYFPEGFSAIHEAWIEVVLRTSSFIFTISHAAAEDIKEFAKKKSIKFNLDRIKVLPLGSEVERAPNPVDMSQSEKRILSHVTQKPFFLMVGTLEPRKGHMQVLKAFEILWKKGINVNLVIVGKEGWMIKNVKKYIKKHHLFRKNLFWLGYVSDTLLKELYKRALALIAASEDEGFGLPVVEAFRHKTPVIARDIKVFREVAGENAFFFKDSNRPEVIAHAIEQWINLYKMNKHPKPGNISRYTWENHCRLFKKYLTEV